MEEQPEELSEEIRKILQEEEAVAKVEVAMDAALEEGLDVTPKEVIEILKRNPR